MLTESVDAHGEQVAKELASRERCCSRRRQLAVTRAAPAASVCGASATGGVRCVSEGPRDRATLIYGHRHRRSSAPVVPTSSLSGRPEIRGAL